VVSSQKKCKARTRAITDVMFLLLCQSSGQLVYNTVGFLDTEIQIPMKQSLWSVMACYVRKFCDVCLMLGENSSGFFKVLCGFREETQ